MYIVFYHLLPASNASYWLGVKIVVHICLAIGSICHLEKKIFVLQEFRNKPSIVQIKISVYHWITYKLNYLTTKVPISFGFWSVTWMHSFWSSCSKNYFKQHICLLNRQRLWHFNESIFFCCSTQEKIIQRQYVLLMMNSVEHAFKNPMLHW